jgi:hypothetical protein
VRAGSSEQCPLLVMTDAEGTPHDLLRDSFRSAIIEIPENMTK